MSTDISIYLNEVQIVVKEFIFQLQIEYLILKKNFNKKPGLGTGGGLGLPVVTSGAYPVAADSFITTCSFGLLRRFCVNN